MAWNDPVTFAVGQLVTADDLNEQLRDNLNYLFARPAQHKALNNSDYTTTSGSFVDIDQTDPYDLTVSLETSGGDVWVHFHGCFVMTNTDLASRARGALDFTVDGTRHGNTDGCVTLGEGGFSDHADNEGGTPVSFDYIIEGLAAGTHTFVMQWKCASDGTGTTTLRLFAGAGSTYNRSKPCFFAREI